MDYVHGVFIGLAIIVFVVVHVALGALAKRRDSARRRRVALHALAAETRSEALLVAAGYTIFDRQVPGSITVWVDGNETRFELRADLIVGDGERNYVAEIKTGELVSTLKHAGTRRQLLEYSIAFDVDGVLLVDADAGEISEVDFAL